MLTIWIDQDHPRVRYSLELIFGKILGIPTSIQVGPSENFPDSSTPSIYYGSGQTALPSFWASPLLFSDSLYDPGQDATLFQDPNFGPISFPAPGGFLLPFDPFSAAFFLATQYQEILDRSQHKTDRFDRHGRPRIGPESVFLKKPLTHVWAKWIQNVLAPIFPGLIFEPRSFSYEITIDLDNPWKYKHKGSIRNLAGLGRDLFFNPGQAWERFCFFLNRHDPWETFGRILKDAPREHTRFFFLGGGLTPHDTRHHFGMPHMDGLLRLIGRDYGFPVGLHPSYLSSESETQFLLEKKGMENVLTYPVLHSRQHYLRVVVPGTYDRLEKSGIQFDYSICPTEYAGFPTGLCIPYPWFNPVENRLSSLTLVPACAMDTGLIQYQNLSPAEGESLLRELIEEVKVHGGHFVLILHNETFSDRGMWAGWRPVIRSLFKRLKEEGRNGSPEDSKRGN